MQYVAAIVATISAAAASAVSYWPSSALLALQSEDSPIGRPITEEEGSWIVSLQKLSVIPAALMGAMIVERFGRKNSMLVMGVFLCFPWFMIAFANSIWVLYVARFIFGIAIGVMVIILKKLKNIQRSIDFSDYCHYCILSTTPAVKAYKILIQLSSTIYLGEVADNDIRGKLSSTMVILRVMGAIIMLCIGPYLSYRNLAFVAAVVPAIFLATFVFMPESPYYLVKRKKYKEAEKNLRILTSNSVDDKYVANRMAEIETCVEDDMRNKTTVWEFVSNPDYRKAIVIIFGMKSLQQLSGETAISAYMQTIISLSDSSISEEVSSVIFGIIQLPAALTASYLVDKIGRKPLLITSAIGSAIALFAIGTFFYFQNVLEADVTPVAWLPTASIALFLIMHLLGISLLPTVLLGELFPTNIKEIAAGSVTFYGGILTFTVSKYFKPLSNLWGMHTLFWFFGTVSVLGTIFAILVIPETKGKSFAEIQAILRNGKIKDQIDNN